MCTGSPNLMLLFCFLLFPFHSDELVHEKEKYKSIADEMDTAFVELAGY